MITFAYLMDFFNQIKIMTKLKRRTGEALSTIELAQEIRKSERSKPIKWEDAKKIISSWK